MLSITSFALKFDNIIGIVLGILSEIKQKGGRELLKFLLIILIIFAAYCTAVTVKILSFKAEPKSIPENTPAIILGCKVNDKTPSEMLENRIAAAYKYLSANENAVVIASGGKGDDENISEAEAIGNSLVEKGVSCERIILEDKSTSTAENMLFSKRIMDETGLGNEAVIITSEFHQLRSTLLAKKSGIKPYNISSKSKPFSLFTSIVREWLAFPGILLK